jgi:Phosphotransferase system cellobiose-specific component IIA
MDLNQIAVSIIAFAGDSQSSSKQAIEYAKQGDFKMSYECIEQAKEALLESHKVHTKLLTECAADEVIVNFLMVHASNHLSVAETMVMMAELFIETLKDKDGERKC